MFYDDTPDNFYVPEFFTTTVNAENGIGPGKTVNDMLCQLYRWSFGCGKYDDTNGYYGALAMDDHNILILTGNLDSTL